MRLRLPDSRQSAHEGSQPYKSAHRRHPWYSFLLEAESTQGHSAAGRITSKKNSNDPFGNGTHDLPACSTVVKRTALHDVKYLCVPRGLLYCLVLYHFKVRMLPLCDTRSCTLLQVFIYLSKKMPWTANSTVLPLFLLARTAYQQQRDLNVTFMICVSRSGIYALYTAVLLKTETLLGAGAFDNPRAPFVRELQGNMQLV